MVHKVMLTSELKGVILNINFLKNKNIIKLNKSKFYFKKQTKGSNK